MIACLVIVGWIAHKEGKDGGGDSDRDYIICG
jgi:hypothetical protein